MSKIPDFLYHYTIGPKMPLIAESGRLLPKGFGAEPREKPVLWLSENPQWDPTANKVVSRDGGVTFVRPTLQELQKLVGIFRFRLDCRRPEALQAACIRLAQWTRMATVARIDARHMADMVKRGMSWGATPTHWWGCMDELPLALEASEMLIIEAREPVAPGEGQKKWERVTMAQAIESFLSRGQRVVMNTATNMPAARNV